MCEQVHASSRIDGGEDQHHAVSPDLPPYVEAKDYLPVRAWVRGFQVDGRVLGWRGDRVYLTWRSDMGSHPGWCRRRTSNGSEARCAARRSRHSTDGRPRPTR